MTSKVDGSSKLFLSCDLNGSTIFKQKSSDGSWRKTFLQFYREFPQALATARIGDETRDLEFHLWKAVGDELIFTCDVHREADVYHAVRTWIDAMSDFSTSLETGLGVKGGAFIATFPGPDSESSIPRRPEFEVSDKDVVELNRTALRGRRANSKYLFDFFGPSIDTGFRVLGKCSGRYFTMSIEVAYAMVCAHITPKAGAQLPLADIVLLEAAELKGVWNGRPYPVFAIDLQADDAVNNALRPFLSAAIQPQEVLELCKACYTSSGWPFSLYLPDGTNSLFHERPVDPMADWKGSSIHGVEELADEPASATLDLPENPPLGDTSAVIE